MEKNYYDILGVDKSASTDDIKKAFRKLSKEWHPDKFATESKEKQQEAEEKFKDITEAHEVLSDPQKRSQYDNPHSGFDFSSFFNHSWDPFGDMFGTRNRQSQQQPTPRGTDVHLEVKLSLEDIYCGCEKTLKYNRYVRCSECDGKGGEDIKTCDKCHGTGRVTITQQNGWMTLQQVVQCDKCGGTGKTVGKVCKKCNGLGLEKTSQEITINIKPFSRHGEIIRVKNGGNECPDKNGLTGNVDIHIVYNIDNDKYKIDNLGNVYHILDVEYYDCILGKTIEIELPNKEKRNIEIPKYSNEDTKITINKMGLNYNGNYIIIVKPHLPESTDEKSVDLLKQLREIGEA